MDKLKSLNGYTNLLAIVVLAFGAVMFAIHQSEAGSLLIGGGLTMLKTGAEHAVPQGDK